MTVPLLLLAAGRSTRFGALKQVAPVGPGGASILAYSVAYGLHAGFSEVVVVVRPEIEATIREHLDAHLGTDLPIRFVHQHAALGTAHAVLVGLDGIDGPAGVANGDDAYGRDGLTQLRQSVDTTASGGAVSGDTVRCALVAYPIAGTLSEHGGVSRGWVQTDGDAVTSIDEIYHVRDEAGEGPLRGQSVTGDEVTLPRDALGSMNLWMLDAGTRALLAREFEQRTADGEFLLSSTLDRLRADGELSIRLAGQAEGWFGLTFAEDLPDATARMAQAHRDGTRLDVLGAFRR